MADRKASHDGSRDSDAFLGDAATPSQGGRAGGNTAREIATEDEQKRALEPGAGVTRVYKADEDTSGNGNQGTGDR